MLKFKINDEVIITNHNDAPEEFVGQKGKIVKLCKNGTDNEHYRVEFENGECWYYDENSIRDVNESEGVK